MRIWIVAAAALALAPLGSAVARDADAGALVFNQQCRVCHTPNEGGRSGIGPNLFRVSGRAAAAIESFRYSAPMRERAAAGLVWNEANLRAYLADPKAVVPAGSMVFPGFGDNVQNISAVIAYLRSVGGQ